MLISSDCLTWEALTEIDLASTDSSSSSLSLEPSSTKAALVNFFDLPLSDNLEEDTSSRLESPYSFLAFDRISWALLQTRRSCPCLRQKVQNLRSFDGSSEAEGVLPEALAFETDTSVNSFSLRAFRYVDWRLRASMIVLESVEGFSRRPLIDDTHSSGIEIKRAVAYMSSTVSGFSAFTRALSRS